MPATGEAALLAMSHRRAVGDDDGGTWLSKEVSAVAAAKTEPMSSIDEAVCLSVSKSFKRRINPTDLLVALKGEQSSPGAEPHLRFFFSELPMEMVVRYVVAHPDLGWKRLGGAYRDHLARGGDRNLLLEEWIARG